jgi:hypothetical protein
MQLSSSYVHIYELYSQTSVHPKSLFSDTHIDCTSHVYIYCYHQFHLLVQDPFTILHTNDTLLVISSILLESDNIPAPSFHSIQIQFLFPFSLALEPAPVEAASHSTTPQWGVTECSQNSNSTSVEAHRAVLASVVISRPKYRSHVSLI